MGAKKSLRILLVLATAVKLWVAAAHADPSRLQLCFVSLNTYSERTQIESLIQKLGPPVGHDQISVRELNPTPPISSVPIAAQLKKTIQEMIERKEHCQGLVFSGHSIASFGGKLAQGQLQLEQIEELARDESLKSWFNHINALWLLGCRTLGIHPAIADTPHFKALLADRASVMLTDVLESDSLEMDVAQVNREYTTVSEHYGDLKAKWSRFFPSATIFGWAFRSPGETYGGENALLFHLAHSAKIAAHRDSFFQSPRAEVFSARSKAAYKSALTQILNGNRNFRSVSILGWQQMGSTQPQEYTYLNPWPTTAGVSAPTDYQVSPRQDYLVSRQVGTISKIERCSSTRDCESGPRLEQLKLQVLGALSNPELNPRKKGEPYDLRMGILESVARIPTQNKIVLETVLDSKSIPISVRRRAFALLWSKHWFKIWKFPLL